jgi:hypothetical protein
MPKIFENEANGKIAFGIQCTHPNSNPTVHFAVHHLLVVI